MIRRLLAAGLLAVVIVVALWADPSSIAIIGTVLGTAISLQAFLFSGLYAVRSNWRSTVAGRALLYAMLGFGAYSAQVTLGSWSTMWTGASGGYPFRLELRLVLYYSIAVTLANMLYTLVTIQRGRK